MSRAISLLLVAAVFLSSCVTVSGVKYTAPETKTWDAVQKDTTECEASVSTYSTAVQEGAKAGALTGLWLGVEGAALGALHGAWQGGASGAADGSWIGAAVGVFLGVVVGVVTGVQKSNEERQPYVELYKSRLRDRGYAIAGEAHPSSSPPSEAPPVAANVALPDVTDRANGETRGADGDQD